MDTDKLEAGRELDALIAECVMGKSVVETEECNGIDNLWLAPYRDEWDDAPLPQYSVKIRAAWAVVEKLGYNWNLYRDVGKCGDDYETSGDGLYRFIYSAPGMPMQGVTASTAPLAICRAALKAVEV